MNPLPYPDRWHLDFARGWLMLGNCQEALQDFQRISPDHHAHPDVLELRCRLLIEQKNWRAALDLLTTGILALPERPMHWIYFSYCLRELGQTERAAKVLSVAVRKFPRHQLAYHNLACYLQQLGRSVEALHCVNRTLALARESE